MAKILFAWELGAGLGHIAPCRGLFEKLCVQNHSLTLVLRDLSRAKTIYERLNLALLQAPVKIYLPSKPVDNATTYTHILHNSGFEAADELEAMVSAWRKIYELIDPDLVIADHSPTALLALRGFRARRMTIGCGFLIPPDTYTFQPLRPWQPFDAAAARADEDVMLKRINTVLARVGAPTPPPLERIGQLFGDVDETVLTTYPELDHYSQRGGGVYWGMRRGFRGVDFEWPAGSGPKIFAYLRPSPNIDTVLQTLKDCGHPTIVCTDQIPAQTREKYESKSLRFENRLLNLDQLAAECSLALQNGNHDTACTLFLAGKPLLLIPITLEQFMFAVAIQRWGGGIMASPDRPGEFEAKFATLLSSLPIYTKAAQRFAARYAQNDPAKLEDLLVRRIEEILDPNWPQRRRPMESPLIYSGEPLLKNTGPLPVPSAEPAATPAYTVGLVRNSAVQPPASPSHSPELDAAVALHQQGKLNEAAAVYQALLAKNANDPTALHLLGVVHLQSGHHAQAVELIGRAITLVPNEASFHSNLAEAYRHLGKFDQAVESCLTALRLRPDYPEACNNLALALQAQGKYKAAVARFGDALKFNPRYIVALNNLGALYGELGQFDDARECFARAKKL